MLAALITVVLFSVSGVAGSRMSRVLGGIEANFARILLATVFLGVWAHTLGQGFSGPGLWFFLASGLIGFGIGDLALYQAFPILKARLSMLLVHCLAAPIAAAAEWFWLGTKLSVMEAACGTLTLSGVALALAPNEHPHLPRKLFWRGIFLGSVAAAGQAFGAVVSRKAYALAEAEGMAIDGMTAAYQRIWGGVLVAGISYAILRCRLAGGPRPPFVQRMRGHWRWLLVNGACGPALGVGFFQWALATTPTGIVLPIIALTPLAVIPAARYFEGEAATWRSIVGGVIAVLGVVGLRLAMH